MWAITRSASIEWPEVTWNPLTGCDRVSPGCDNCYAQTLAKRLKAVGSPRYQIDGDPHSSGPGFGVACHEELVEQQTSLIFGASSAAEMTMFYLSGC